MIAMLRQLTILKRLFIMLILAAIGTVCFGSFSVKEQYNNLVTDKYAQLAVGIEQLVTTLDFLQQHASDETLNDLVEHINQQTSHPIYILHNNKRLVTTMANPVWLGSSAVNNLLEQSHTKEAIAELRFSKGNQQTDLFMLAKFDSSLQKYFVTQAPTDEIHSALKSTMIDYLIIMLLISVPIFLFFLLLNHSITQPINVAINAMKDIAAGEGDLRQRLDEKGKDEVSQLAIAFNMFVEKIANVVAQLHPISDQLTTHSEHLLTNVNTAQQSSQNVNQETQSVATAMHEMLTTTQDMAGNTSQAAQSAAEVKTQAEQGLKLMQTTVDQGEALGQELKRNVEVSQVLSKSSSEITSILDVIKSIAEQTNLLALNAAIEAARAGSHGRGFAVVADEVRALANRTQDSTNEINQIVSKINEGINSLLRSNNQTQQQSDELQLKASQSSDAMQNILLLIANISDVTAQLASATEQQAMVTEEINLNINAISDLTHKEVAANESNKQQAQMLGQISASIDNTLKQFKI
ncbi:methyl-accepting chemotaxis protein [Shewanella aestuarii]|uniref:Methyl-accepting chemotaxis protein n=1 Tax=Shewanella aestuarii TaxID=1028752 RepID=A0A6G9QJR1_9GAMM|nr:methyl-accepting chemotaxis protein [Shewanella aestuarii]QIR14712.1 methyl-accepting chemotaxis protein [Shewanella aestuarii]